MNEKRLTDLEDQIAELLNVISELARHIKTADDSLDLEKIERKIHWIDMLSSGYIRW